LVVLRANLTIAAVLISAAVGAQAQDFGKYIGSIQTEWLGDGLRMRLLANFSYIDPNGVEWKAPAGRIVDGASIPWFAWSFIGGPFEGRYRDASVIHDIACEDKDRAWEVVHEAFYWGMRASQVETWRAKVMYAAVYHRGPRWPRRVVIAGIPKEQTPVARQKALELAAPGSTAQILNIRPLGRTLDEVLRNQPEKAEFDIVVQPPTRQLSDEDLDKLKERIEATEASATGGISLQDIRTFRP
jgi:hypothetical protein